MTNHDAPAFGIFTRLSNEWDEALAANDADRIAAFAADEWTFLGPDGPFPGSDFLAATSPNSKTLCTSLLMVSWLTSPRAVRERRVDLGRVYQA